MKNIIILFTWLYSAIAFGQTANTYFENGIREGNKGNYTKAIEWFDKAINLDKNDKYKYNWRGFAKNELGHYQSAIKDYDKAIEIDPNYKYAYNGRGNAKESLGQYQSAIKDYDKAIELDPNYKYAYNNRGTAKYNLGHYQSAIKDYDKAIELDPNDEVCYNNRGTAKEKLGHYESAIKDYDKAIEIDPNFKYAYNGRGFAKRKLGQYQSAIKDYDKAIEIDPNFTIAINNRADALKKLQEQKDKAKNTTENIALYWLSPNLDKANYETYTSPTLPIEIKALGGQNLTKSDFKVYINGSLVSASRSDEVSLIGTTFSARITLKDHKNEIEVRVGRHRSKVLTAYYSGKPTLHLLAVAPSFANSYNSQTLKYTDDDARDIVRAFQTQHTKGIYQNIHITELIGEKAVAKEVEKAVERLKMQYQYEEIKKRDVVLVFLSSHGFMSGKDYYIKGNDYHPYSPTSSSIASKDIMEHLAAIHCKKIVVIDACYAGGAHKDDMETQAIHSTIEALTDGQTGIVTFTSSKDTQKSWEHDDWRNGAFTYAFIQGLNGAADYNKNHRITLKELYRYLKAKVPALVHSKYGELQMPQMHIKGLDGDMPIFVY